MGYRIVNVVGNAGANLPVAEFLAAFVRDGELALPRPGDDDARVWEQRMRWWWDENPHCRDDSPRGFILEDESGEVVGFNGFIPFDYEVNGEPVPTLVTTSFFVREGHRSAVMGMLTRQRSLGKTHQIIDGSPSPEMRRLLEKLGYVSSGGRRQYLFPTSCLGGGAARAVLRRVGWSFALPAAEGFSVTGDPAAFADVTTPHDGRIHRRLSADSLSWLCRVGSARRQFFGLLDCEGNPLAYAIGLFKEKAGVKGCLLMDYQDLHPDGVGLSLLLRKLLDDPAGSGLDLDTGLLLFSRFESDPASTSGGIRRDSILHYHLPPACKDREKACRPFEGDLPLL